MFAKHLVGNRLLNERISFDFAKQFPPHVESKVKNEFNVQSRLRILTELDNQIEILASSEAAHILVIFEG